MDNTIVVNVNMFNLNQVIMIIDKNGDCEKDYSVTTNDLPIALVNTCRDNKIEKINLIGNKHYTEQIAEAIYEYEAKEYSTNNINIEIMED